MEKKKLNVPKAVLSLALCLALIFTSLPLVIAREQEGRYDPIPTFPNQAVAASFNKSVAAVAHSDGSVTVQFPAAEVHNGETGKPPQGKTVKYYLLEASDLGVFTEAHVTPTAPFLTKLITPTDDHIYSVVLTKEELEAGLGRSMEHTHRYNVRVTAIDSDNWYSEPLNALISTTPIFVLDTEANTLLSLSQTAMREIVVFEKSAPDRERGYAGLNPIGGATALVGAVENADYVKAGSGALEVCGVSDQVGARNTAGTKDTTGYRLRIRGEGAASFDTSFSRQAYDIAGATEVWFWVDLRQVELNGLSFRLRANEKSWSADGVTQNGLYGDSVFSTAGCGNNSYAPGEEPYVFLQLENGTWTKTPLRGDGKIDLGHYTGYVRIPIRFLCSEADSKVSATNTGFGSGGNAALTNAGVVIDPAGTPISEALLCQHSDNGRMLAAGWETSDVQDPEYYVIHKKNGAEDAYKAKLQMDGSAAVTDESGRALVDHRETGMKAVNDIMSAGLAYDSIGRNSEKSLDSVDKTFFMDNVMAYSETGGPYQRSTIQGSAENYGSPVEAYYSQQNEVVRAILREADAIIDVPGIGSYREVKYIEDMIKQYSGLFGQNSSFLNYKAADGNLLAAAPGNLPQKAKDLNLNVHWLKFADAYAKCRAGGTYLDPAQPSTNSGPDDLVPQLAERLAKLDEPWESGYNYEDPEQNVPRYIHVTPALRDEIKILYTLYKNLNRAQLKTLGRHNEDKLIVYLRLLEGFSLEEEIPLVGSGLADGPFIPFNTFENDALGKRAYQLENDPEFMVEKGHCTLPGDGPLSYWGVHRNYLYRKGLVSFSSSEFRDTNGHNNIEGTATQFAQYGDNIKFGFQATGPVAESGGIRYDPACAEITNQGFLGTQGLTMTVGAQYFDSHDGGQGDYNTLSVTRERAGGSAEIVDPANMGDLAKQAQALRAVDGGNSNMHDEKLGEMWIHRKSGNERYMDPEKMDPEKGELPLSIAMYVDFSEIRDFFFDMSITTVIEHKESEHGDDPAGLGWVDSQVGVDKFGLDVVGTKLEGFLSSGGLKGYVWMLNGETGEFERTQVDTTNPYTINSGDMKYTKSDGSVVTLDGYKGWIMIPLYSFLRLAGTSWASQPPLGFIHWPPLLQAGAVGEHLDGHFDTLNNIWRVDVNVAPQNAAAAAAMDGKSFTIDNIGFTYDPSKYGVQLAARNHPDESFDHYFPAKSTSARDFEDLVAQLNPYDGEPVFSEKRTAARTAYENLSETQKGFVGHALARLEFYETIGARDPVVLATLNSGINGLPSALTADPGVSLPAILDTYNGLKPIIYGTDGKPQVNYAAFGLTAGNFEDYKNTVNNLWADAQKLSTANRGIFFGNTPESRSDECKKLLKARAVVTRVAYLEKLAGEAAGVEDRLTSLYMNSATSEEHEGARFIKGQAARPQMLELYKEYLAADYHAKAVIRGDDAANKYKELPSAIHKLLLNTRTDVADSSGPVKGGVIVRTAEYDGIKAEAEAIAKPNYLKPDPNACGHAGTPEKEWQRMKDKVVEYENYPDYLYQISELWMPIEAVIGAFPGYDAVKPPDIVVTKSAPAGSGDLNVTYLTDFLVRENTAAEPSNRMEPGSYADWHAPAGAPYQVPLRYRVEYTGELTAGTAVGGGTSPTANYTLSFAGQQGGTDMTDIAVTSSGGTAPVITAWFENNSATNDAPCPLKFTATLAGSAPDIDFPLKETVKVTLVDADGNPIKDANDEAQTYDFDVIYAPSDFYTVTIPADVTIPWGDINDVDVHYKVEHRLRAAYEGQSGAELEVKISGSNVLKRSGTAHNLPYISYGFEAETFTGRSDTPKTHAAAVKIAADAWNSVPIAVYQDTLTYTVTYTPPAPAS